MGTPHTLYVSNRALSTGESARRKPEKGGKRGQARFHTNFQIRMKPDQELSCFWTKVHGPSGAALGAGVNLTPFPPLFAGYGAAVVWPLPAAVPGEPGQAMAWVQALTGLELDAGNAVQPLDSRAWEERLAHLKWPGGGVP